MTLQTPFLLALLFPGLHDDAFTGTEPAAIRALVLPTSSEKTWLEIPWHTSLWEARRVAAREGKPILLWEMDGNPLGCT